MHIRPLGDSALVIQVCERLAAEPEETLREVVSVWRRLEAASLPGVIEVAPAYTTVAVYYEERKLGGALYDHDSLEWLYARIADVLTKPTAPTVGEIARTIEIPVCYGGAWGPDLPDVAR